MNGEVSTAEAAISLGISAPLIRACVDGGLLEGSHQIISAASLIELDRRLDATAGPRAHSILVMLRKTSESSL